MRSELDLQPKGVCDPLPSAGGRNLGLVCPNWTFSRKAFVTHLAARLTPARAHASELDLQPKGVCDLTWSSITAHNSPCGPNWTFSRKAFVTRGRVPRSGRTPGASELDLQPKGVCDSSTRVGMRIWACRSELDLQPKGVCDQMPSAFLLDMNTTCPNWTFSRKAFVTPEQARNRKAQACPNWTFSRKAFVTAPWLALQDTPAQGPNWTFSRKAFVTRGRVPRSGRTPGASELDLQPKGVCDAASFIDL